MTTLHFELTSDTRQHLGVTLHQIRATRDLPQHGVRAGDVGGWIEKASNLSDNARVFGTAWVFDNAQVFGDAQVFDNAQVCGDARVFGTAHCITVSPIGSEDVTATLHRTTTGHR